MEELTEKDLELVVSKQELGILETNALIIKEKVTKALENYDSKNYNEQNVELAIKDRALLNKAAKALNDKRIDLEKKFMSPFLSFKTIINDTTKIINEASSKIDEVVKSVENKVKEEKKARISKIFDEKVAELKDVLAFEKIFNERWLNKTYKIEDIEKEISDRVNTIRQDLVTIGNLNSKYEIELKNDYLANFDLGKVINKNADLENKEKLLKQQQQFSEEKIEEQKAEKLQTMSTTKVETKVVDPIITYTLKITGKASQLKALRFFLETNEMTFEKVE